MIVYEHRHVLPIPLFERGVAVDVNDRQIKMKPGLQHVQARDHLIAEMAEITAVYRQQGAQAGQFPSTLNGI